MSDRDSWTDPINDTPESPVKRGMSGCLWASLILGGIGLFSSIVCCGFFTWLIYIFVPTETNVPEEVIAVKRQILDAEMIDSFSPAKAFTIENVFMVVRVAEFKHKEGKGELLIASATLKMNDPNIIMNAEQWGQFRGYTETRIRAQSDIKKMDTHEVTIQGEKVNIAVGEGVDREDGKAIHLATSEFSHAGRLFFFLIRMEDDGWNQEAVFKMLESSKMP